MDTARALVRGCYDIQKLRIMIGNRICMNFYRKLGLTATTENGAKSKGSELGPEAEKMIAKLKKEYKNLAAGVAANRRAPRQFPADGLFSNTTEFILFGEYVALEKSEDRHFAEMRHAVETTSIGPWLLGIRGIGPASAGVLISEFDPHKARHVSSFWKYCGLDVASDGLARSRRAEHMREYEYVDTEGGVRTKLGLTYNPWLRSKLYGALGASLLRSKSPYVDIYHNYKTRMENHAKWGISMDKAKQEDFRDQASPLRRHRQSMRYMLKMFLRDLWVEWRQREGLPVTPTYAEAKLGLQHGAGVSA